LGSNKANVDQPFTYFLVMKPTGWGTGGYQTIVDMGGADGQRLAKSASATTLLQYSGADLVGESLSNNTSYIISAVYSGASSSNTVNGNNPTTGNAGTSVNEMQPIIGALATGGAYYFTGYVMEWLVYNGALSDADQATVRNYLNAKWAIY
jgi:hypothetical protein